MTREPEPGRSPGELRDPFGSAAIDGAPATDSSVSIAPKEHPAFVRAVESAGGRVAPLGSTTTGLVWCDGTSEGCRRLETVLRGHPSIEWVQLPWAGVEHFIPLLRSLRGRRITWTCAKGAYSEPVAEHALALILAVLRHLPEKARLAGWQRPATGTTLFGRRVLIVGGGGIAARLAALLAPWEVDLTVVRPSASEVPGARRTVSTDEIDPELARAEIVVLAAPSTGGTAHLLNEQRLRLMQDRAVIVNVARGSLVDTAALVNELERGRFTGVALDVTEPEPLPQAHRLWEIPRVLVTSHSADTEEMVERLLAQRLETNTRAHLARSGYVGVIDPVKGY